MRGDNMANIRAVHGVEMDWVRVQLRRDLDRNLKPLFNYWRDGDGDVEGFCKHLQRIIDSDLRPWEWYEMFSGGGHFDPADLLSSCNYVQGQIPQWGADMKLATGLICDELTELDNSLTDWWVKVRECLIASMFYGMAQAVSHMEPVGLIDRNAL